MNAPQYITDSEGNKLSVVLPIKAYENIMKLLEEWEDMEDVRLYDEAKKEDDGERIPIEEAFRMIEEKRKMAI